MFICTFTITIYGTSGNELPPKPERSYTCSVLSGHESEQAFRDQMQTEGMAIRDLLQHRYDEKPKPYSCPDSCDWSISPVGSITALVREISARLR